MSLIEAKNKKNNLKSKKFNILIDINNNPVIWIDDIVHFFTQSQYDALLKDVIKKAKEMNPEVDYTKYLK